MNTKIFLNFIILLIILTTPDLKAEFSIGRLKYEGGDWYSDPTSLTNLLKFVSKETGVKTSEYETTIEPGDGNLYDFPYLYLTGHGEIKFTDEQYNLLRKHIEKGGFLHADDNYGLDKHFRKFVKKLFPDKELKLVPLTHPIYQIKYKFENGLPKIHKHDDKNPEGYGIFISERLAVFYSYECDLGDGWEDEEVHNDPLSKRIKALQMGCNLVLNFLNYRDKK